MEITGYKEQPELACCCNCYHVYPDYDGIFECQNPEIIKEVPGDLSRWVDAVGVCPRFQVKE